MRALLASLPSGEIKIIIKLKRPPKDGETFECTASHGTMRTGSDDMPIILKDSCVPLDKWWLMYTLILEELMPISLKCIQSNMLYNGDMKTYLSDQKLNYTDTTWEKLVHMKGVQTGI